MDWTQYIGEAVIGIILGLFAWGFRGWASTIRESTKELLTKMEVLAKEFHDHVVKTESRVRGVEKDIEHLKSSCDE